MNPTKPRRLSDTRIFLGAINANLWDPKTIKFLKENKITKVFCLYPLKQEQFSRLDAKVKKGALDLQGYYSKLKIDPLFVTKLNAAGIVASSLLRGPDQFREYASFTKEAVKAKNNILIQCFGGWHTSGAYAMYYLATATPLGVLDITEKFIRSGYKLNDLKLINEILQRAKIDLKEVVKKKNEMRRIAAKMRAESKTRRPRKKKTTRQPYKRRKKG